MVWIVSGELAERRRGWSREVTRVSLAEEDEVMMTFAPAFKAICVDTKRNDRISQMRSSETDSSSAFLPYCDEARAPTHLRGEQRDTSSTHAQDRIPSLQDRMMSIQRILSGSCCDRQGASLFEGHMTGHPDQLGLVDGEIF